MAQMKAMIDAQHNASPAPRNSTGSPPRCHHQQSSDQLHIPLFHVVRYPPHHPRHPQHQPYPPHPHSYHPYLPPPPHHLPPHHYIDRQHYRDMFPPAYVPSQLATASTVPQLKKSSSAKEDEQRNGLPTYLPPKKRKIRELKAQEDESAEIKHSLAERTPGDVKSNPMVNPPLSSLLHGADPEERRDYSPPLIHSSESKMRNMKCNSATVESGHVERRDYSPPLNGDHKTSESPYRKRETNWSKRVINCKRTKLKNGGGGQPSVTATASDNRNSHRYYPVHPRPPPPNVYHPHGYYHNPYYAHHPFNPRVYRPQHSPCPRHAHPYPHSPPPPSRSRVHSSSAAIMVTIHHPPPYVVHHYGDRHPSHQYHAAAAAADCKHRDSAHHGEAPTTSSSSTAGAIPPQVVSTKHAPVIFGITLNLSVGRVVFNSSLLSKKDSMSMI
mmetsp:Transcript_18459/g.33911  ORF Transcript_18459/g.33911 Transcript_18459/m.33911 type:complete len:441 (-) Transcript_18459:307-1629(-)|eukprot:CAMPEP_0202021484 /NCGR_PEP_ID=MMETSP0905-20130828/47107_1 /ASSEMBLY_ACC=CAM_ASM_000554 /TAXON_ID=420261 /ORGANISM="Thalassiosira antarctica, Strain CCMP982" /LENGTH=440 /DNA_ID=CAMNT_0048583383 /DNA_START=201 /DNA_END=1523 /DNA_ORIENTATION=+